MKLEQSLTDLAQAMRHLHKALIDAEAENFGPINGPYRFLDLVAYHPHFDWLHALSELMVEIDELREDMDAVDADETAALRTTVEQLVGPREPVRLEFRERYLAMLQQSPEVVMAHGELRQVLAEFPTTEPDDSERQASRKS